MSTRTSSLLQSQKLVSNSRSSSGVRRSEENAVGRVSSATWAVSFDGTAHARLTYAPISPVYSASQDTPNGKKPTEIW
jgi:hypothetical protein